MFRPCVAAGRIGFTKELHVMDMISRENAGTVEFLALARN
jgi:hypothetical protein